MIISKVIEIRERFVCERRVGVPGQCSVCGMVLVGSFFVLCTKQICNL
jgi:hypothetical protein